MTSYSQPFLGEIVKVEIDRPLGGKHPKHGFAYELNYGFVPNTLAPDGEELDAYVLGVDVPVEYFEGRCIAIIHRLNDNDDKLIVAPDGINYSDEEIMRQCDFQEKYFECVIVR